MHRASEQGPGPANDGFDPWLEVVRDNLTWNVEQLSRAAGGRPVLAVLKNGAYGHGVVGVARHLATLDTVRGLAVWNLREGLQIREAGIDVPVLLLGPVGASEVDMAVRHDLALALFHDHARELVHAARRHGTRARVHVYVDTGLGRFGVPHHRVMPFVSSLARHREIRIDGVMTGLAEDPEFDREQAARLSAVHEQARTLGIDLGPRHAASSAGVLDSPDAHLDMIRPGIALYGVYPSAGTRERRPVELRPALRWKARVAYVKQLRAGDSLQYHRTYVAERPTWIATLGVGHTDGWPPKAAGALRVRIHGKTHPIVASVTGNHTLVELGEHRTAEIGDVVTLMDTDEELGPHAVADGAGVGVYKLLWGIRDRVPRTYV